MPVVTQEDLGAWVFKCNPAVWDLRAFMDDGNDWIDDWSVADNYRSAMLEPGQRALLWVTGNDPNLPRGFWGSGWVTGAVDRTVLDEDEDEGVEEEPGYWIDEEYRLKTRLFASLDLPLWEAPVEAAEVAAAVPDFEILVQPQMSNPSWVSAEQLARLLPLLPEWPDQEEVAEVVVVDGRGAEYAGDPVANAVVERVAMRIVREHYEERGWKVDDVSEQKVGWDLTCRKGSTTHRVEVKGRSTRKPIVLLTPNELRAAGEEKTWQLAVVTDALHKPVLTIYDADRAVSAAVPFIYRLDLS